MDRRWCKILFTATISHRHRTLLMIIIVSRYLLKAQIFFSYIFASLFYLVFNSQALIIRVFITSTINIDYQYIQSMQCIIVLISSHNNIIPSLLCSVACHSIHCGKFRLNNQHSTYRVPIESRDDILL